jgi:hypothetical protein
MKRQPYKTDAPPLDLVSDYAVAYAHTIDISEQKHTKKQGVCSENSITPNGYMSIEQFRKEAKTSLTKILNEHDIYHLTEEQRQAIVQAQQAVARGEFISNEKMQKAVELWANGN